MASIIDPPLHPLIPMATPKLQVTTSNIRKLARFREILAPLGWEIVGKPVGYRVLEADPQKLQDMLLLEAREYAKQSGLPTLVDESYFEVSNKGTPELLSVHQDQHMSEAERVEKLRQRYEGYSLEQRRARFQTRMVLAFPDGSIERYMGETPGIMIDRPRGTAGFGYDPMFLTLETGKTLAEMSSNERDHFSPWERALRMLLEKHLLDRLGLEYGREPSQAPEPLAQTPPPATASPGSTLPNNPAVTMSTPQVAVRKQILMATSNPGKIRELREALSPLGWELRSLLDFNFQLPPEDGLTFEDNALIKAAFACQHSRLVSLADDSGLEVEALGGEPGVRSARFGGKHSDTERNVYLLERLRGVPVDQRTARFVAVIALAYPDGNVEMYRGETRGKVLEAPRGTWGFGYDPLFLVEETGQTFAEMTLGQKQKFSHRGKALSALLEAHKSGFKV